VTILHCDYSSLLMYN